MMGRTTFGGSHLISVRNTDGSVAWEQQGPYEVGNHLGQVVLLPDSGLLHIGVHDACDYFGPDSRLRRYSPQGDILWERLFPESLTYPLSMAAQGSTNHLAVASEDFVYFLDLDGNTTSGFPVPLSEYVNGMVWASDSTLYMGRGPDLKLVGMDGTQLATTPVGYVADMYWDGEQLYVLTLTDDSVHRYAPNLEPLGSSLLPGADSQTPNRFIPTGNAVYVYTADGLYELGPGGIPGLAFPWPLLPDLVTTGCAVRDNAVLAVGNTTISGRSTGIVRMLSMSGEAAQHHEDVEVLMEVGSAWVEYTGFPSYPWDWKADVTGVVVNHGPDTLRSVVLSMWVDIPVDYTFCGLPVNRIDTIGLALAPADTALLPFGEVDVRMGSTVAGGTSAICMVALAPDRLADRDPDDNTACATADFVMGMEGQEGLAPISVFPNPASDHCTVSGLGTLGALVQVRVLDLAGRIMSARFGNVLGNNLELDVSSLPPGTYILDAMGGQARSTAKLIVVRP